MKVGRHSIRLTINYVFRIGQDGVSPTISVEDIDGGHRVTIQDKDGIKSFEVLNGDGENIKPISNEEIENLFK